MSNYFELIIPLRSGVSSNMKILILLLIVLILNKIVFQKQLFRVCVLRWVHGEPDGGQGDLGQGRQIHQVSHKLISNVNYINYIN